MAAQRTNFSSIQIAKYFCILGNDMKLGLKNQKFGACAEKHQNVLNLEPYSLQLLLLIVHILSKVSGGMIVSMLLIFDKFLDLVWFRRYPPSELYSIYV